MNAPVPTLKIRSVRTLIPLALALLGSVAAVTPCDGARRLSLEEALRMALAGNPDVMVAATRIDEASARIVQERAAALPQLNGRAAYSRNLQLPSIFFNEEGEVHKIQVGSDNSYEFSLSLRQPLWQGGKVGAALSAANDYAASSREAFRQTEAEVAFRVRQAYYGAQLAVMILDVNRLSLSVAEEQLKQVKSFYERGTASEFDLLRAQVEMQNRRAPVTEAESGLIVAQDHLKQVLGLPLEEELELTTPLAVSLEPPEPEDPAAYAREHHPALRAQRLQLRMTESALRVAKGNRYPSVYFSWDLYRQGQSDDWFPRKREFAQSMSAGLEVQVPVFDGLRTKALIRQAQATHRRAEEQLRALEDQVLVEVRAALLEFGAAREELDAQEATVGQAERALELAQVRFREGLATQVEVLDSQLALTQARTNQARTLYRLNLAHARIERALGLAPEGNVP